MSFLLSISFIKKTKLITNNPRLFDEPHHFASPRRVIDKVSDEFDIGDVDVKPDVDSEGSLDVEFTGDTWPKLEPIQFKAQLPIDPRQAFVDEPEDDNEILCKQVVGVHLVSASSSEQSLPSTDVPQPALGPAASPRKWGRPKGSKNRRRDPVDDPNAVPAITTPRKYAGAHNNMALRD